MSQKVKTKSEMEEELDKASLLLQIEQLKNESLAKDLEIVKLQKNPSSNIVNNDTNDLASVIAQLPVTPFVNACEDLLNHLEYRKYVLENRLKDTDDFGMITEYTRLIYKTKQQFLRAFEELKDNQFVMRNYKKMESKDIEKYQKIYNNFLEKENIKHLPKPR